LLLDSFDNVTLNKHFGPEFFSFLRAQAALGKVSYVTASRAPLYEISHRSFVDSPFFNIFYTYTLGALTHEEAQELVRVPAQKAGMPFADTEVEWVLDMAGRHPFFIQRVCDVLFEEKLQSDHGEVDMLAVRNQVYKDLFPHFLDAWERLSEVQQITLLDEAHQIRELPELSESAFFRQFVHDNHVTKMFQMTADELEYSLAEINDFRALGETNLRLMNIVSKSLRRGTVPLTVTASVAVERGIAIREILDKALERLRGSGVRTDSAPEWRLYNTLYYRYFDKKHHMTNEQIAARLGFTSTRQYYRERSRAIEALLGILFEIGMASNKEEQ